MDMTAATVRLQNASTRAYFDDAFLKIAAHITKQVEALDIFVYAALLLFSLLTFSCLVYRCTKRHSNTKSTVDQQMNAKGSTCDFHDVKEKEVILNEKDAKASKTTDTFEEKLNEDLKGNKEVTELLIGADGGSLSCRNITLTIPAGALKTSANIQISTLPQENISLKGKNYICLSKILHCEPSGLNFLKPYTVIVNTCYHPIGGKDFIPLQVFTRKHNEDLWSKESQTTLGSDGKITFTAQHFSDRVLQAEERLASSLGKSLHSLVFLRSLSSSEKEVIWYVMDESAETFQRIKSLNQDAMKNNEYGIFCVQVNRNLSLRLQLTNPDLITLDRSQASIDQNQFRQEKVAIPSKFLVTKGECRFFNNKVVGFSYSITETRPSPVRCYADFAEDKRCLSGSIYFKWDITTEEELSVNATEPVSYGNVDNVGVGSVTNAERNSSQHNSQMLSNSSVNHPQVQRSKRSNNLVAGSMENARSGRAIRSMQPSLINENLQCLTQRQQFPVKPASRARYYNSFATSNSENTSLLEDISRRQAINNSGVQGQLSTSNNGYTCKNDNRYQAVGRQIRCSGIHQPNSIFSSFRTQQNLTYNISEEDESEMESPDNLHTDTSEGLLHNLNNYSSSEVESKSESDSDAYQHPRAITYV